MHKIIELMTYDVDRFNRELRSNTSHHGAAAISGTLGTAVCGIATGDVKMRVINEVRVFCSALHTTTMITGRGLDVFP